MFFELLRDGLILMRACGAHPSDFCSGKSHQNHSLRDATLRSSAKPAQKELGIFDPSNTFLLYPALPAVLSGVQSQWVYFSVKL
jgi:hypothetical protein